MLNPDLARTLMMKASPANRPIIAQRLGSQIAALTAANAEETTNRKSNAAPVQLPPRMTVPAPAIIPPSAPFALVPMAR